MDDPDGTRTPDLDDEEDRVNASGEWLEDWERRTRVHGARAPHEEPFVLVDEGGMTYTPTRSEYHQARRAA